MLAGTPLEATSFFRAVCIRSRSLAAACPNRRFPPTLRVNGGFITQRSSCGTSILSTGRQEQHSKERKDGNAERRGQSAAHSDSPITEAPSSDPSITGEIQRRSSHQKSPTVTPAQEVKVAPEAVPEPRRSWKWILGGTMLIVGAMFLAGRFESR